MSILQKTAAKNLSTVHWKINLVTYLRATSPALREEAINLFSRYGYISNLMTLRIEERNKSRINMRVNIDYIPVIRQNGNLVKLDRIEIEKPFSLLTDLKEIMDSKSHCILDLQSIMYKHYSENERSNIRFLSPLSYYSTYVNGVDFPEHYTLEEYEEFVQKTKEDVIDSHSTTLDQIREKEGDAKYEEKVNQYLESELDIKKRDYYNRCIRFIDAHSYQKSINKCKSDSSIKMHSVEEDGWASYSHLINDDVTISVSTNFGYGNSSYFHLSLKYKGIAILPYSFIVDYYYANMRDLCWLTRNYYAKAENWNKAFRFVEEVTNLATSDTERFCNEFLKGEIDKMLSGLAEAVEKPTAFFNSFTTQANGDPSETYLGVRNIYDYEISRYRTFPEDLSIVLMAEKIMNSRYFLGNLSSLAEVYPLAMSAVDKIKEYGKVALPKIQENCLKNKRRIEDCKRAIQALEDKIKILEYKKAEQEKLIDAIYEQQKAEKFRSTVYREYEEEHPEYRQIKEDISTAEQRVKALRYEIHTREVYIIGKLEECISTLDE